MYSRNYAHLLENQKRYGLLQYSNIRVYRVFNISSIIGQICLKTDKKCSIDDIFILYDWKWEENLMLFKELCPSSWKSKTLWTLQYSNIRVYRVFNKSLIIGQLCLKTDKMFDWWGKWEILMRSDIFYYMTENERKTWCYSRIYAPLTILISNTFSTATCSWNSKTL